MGLSAFRNIEPDVLKGLGSGQKVGLGVHNSLLQMGGSAFGYGSASAWGAGAGAAYGAIDGGLSYDGSILGGAFHGAMLGAAGGAGLKFASETYAKGAVLNEFATGSVESGFTNAWRSTNSKFAKNGGGVMNPFQTSAFKGGW